MAKKTERRGVRGPNSALTEFLRVEGITDGFRRRQQENIEAEERGREEDEEDVEQQVVNSNRTRRSSRRNQAPKVEDAESDSDSGSDEYVVSIKKVGREKLARARRSRRATSSRNGGNPGSDSDDDSDGDPSNSDSDANFSDGNSKLKKFGEVDQCVDCGDDFNISVYLRYDKTREGYLCENCQELLRKKERAAARNQLNARKRRKKMALALLDKSEIKVPTLQDVCIKRITENINDVEALGDIGQVHMSKISQILSKNRSLNDNTLDLFLSPGLKELKLWDCLNVDSDSLNKIALICPNLELLTLFMCGQLHNDNLKYFYDKLKNLKELALNGPFLISEDVWQEYFENCSPLNKFEVRNTHRFTSDSLISLLESQGSTLKLLKLSRLDGIDLASIYDLIPHYLQPGEVTEFEISYPHTPELITDNFIVNLLSIIGENLILLNLDGCESLSDKILEGISSFCPNLTQLSLRGLNQLTDTSFSKAINDHRKLSTGGFNNVDLTKCSGLGDQAIYSLLRHSHDTLLELSLNSVYPLSKKFFVLILTDETDPKKVAMKERYKKEIENGNGSEMVYYEEIIMPLLTTLDVGFVSCVDDEIVSLIGGKCEKLKILEVFGDNRCNSMDKVREGLLVIGRQSDTL